MHDNHVLLLNFNNHYCVAGWLGTNQTLPQPLMKYDRHHTFDRTQGNVIFSSDSFFSSLQIF
jgi:hypothetical protein